MQNRVLLTAVRLAALAIPLFAQSQQETTANPAEDAARRAQEQRLRQELATPYQRWLDQEVRWIVTREEHAAFSRLETDAERLAFIENFWLRRDPTPDTTANEYREEHYRRIAWANDRFAASIPGWKTDRGMIYIKFGAPDEREVHPAGNAGEAPYERWRYRSMEGIGEGIGRDIVLEFVDKEMNNEYQLNWDPSDADALLRAPAGGLAALGRQRSLPQLP